MFLGVGSASFPGQVLSLFLVCLDATSHAKSTNHHGQSPSSHAFPDKMICIPTKPWLKINLSYFSFPEWQRLTNTENWYQEWGCCCNKPDCVVHGSLKLTCGKNVEEFKSVSQRSLGMLSIELNRFYCMEKQNVIGYADSKDSWSFEGEKDIKGIELQVQFMLHSGKKIWLYSISWLIWVRLN